MKKRSECDKCHSKESIIIAWAFIQWSYLLWEINHKFYCKIIIKMVKLIYQFVFTKICKQMKWKSLTIRFFLLNKRLTLRRFFLWLDTVTHHHRYWLQFVSMTREKYRYKMNWIAIYRRVLDSSKRAVAVACVCLLLESMSLYIGTALVFLTKLTLIKCPFSVNSNVKKHMNKKSQSIVQT